MDIPNRLDLDSGWRMGCSDALEGGATHTMRRQNFGLYPGDVGHANGLANVLGDRQQNSGELKIMLENHLYTLMHFLKKFKLAVYRYRWADGIRGSRGR